MVKPPNKGHIREGYLSFVERLASSRRIALKPSLLLEVILYYQTFPFHSIAAWNRVYSVLIPRTTSYKRPSLTYVLCHLSGLGSGYDPVPPLFPQVPLKPQENDGCVGTVVGDLGVPLVPNVAERGGGYDGETQKEDVGLRVGERPETVVVFLASCKK